MRVSFGWALLLFGMAVPAAAQTACPAGRMDDEAKAATVIRHRLHAVSVREEDAAVPTQAANELQQLKNALTEVAAAAFRCASSGASAEELQRILATALHANEASATESATETRDKKDVGAYGSDLAVQVFPLFGTPKLFEVDFRYGIECGDDNLLLVFETASDTATEGWHLRLRWDAPSYNTVGDALGDFVLLTPLTGSYEKPTWHFLVAHGHPACGESPRPSRFDLDLLTPTEDPAKPAVSWHFEHAYSQGNSVPRLATTENTIDFRMTPAPGGGTGKADKPSLPQSAEVFRFHLTADGKVEPIQPADAAAAGPGSSTATAQPPTVQPDR